MTGPAPDRLSEITVVVPTLGRDALRDCLSSIVAGDAWPSSLIVIDQGSNSAVQTWIRELNDRGLSALHVRSGERGTAAATNRGLAQVRTRWVAVTHDDCRVAPEWLRRMSYHLRASPDAIVTGMVKPEAEGHTPSVITTPYPAVYRRPLIDRDPLFPANMGFAVETGRRVGPFCEDPRLRFAEDAEWSYRALRRGCTIRYAPDVVVEHRDWRTRDQLAATYRNYARSQGAFYGLYLRRRDGFILLRTLHDVLRGPWAWIRGLATGHDEVAIFGMAYMRQLVPGVLDGLRGEGR